MIWRFPFQAVLAIALTGGAIASATESNAHYLMGTIGDSISAATFADSSVNVRWVGETLEDEMLLRVPFLGNQENKETLSWSSGGEIPSHFMRLTQFLKQTAPGASLQVLNVAVPGEKTEGILAQAEAIVDAMKSGNYASVKYITLMIGANDACSKDFENGTPLQDMTEQMRAAFKKLADIRQDEPIRILVSGMPRIPDLGRAEFANTTSALGYSCRAIRRIHGFCKSLLNWEGEAEYAKKLEVVKDRNLLLGTMVREASAAYSNMQVVFTDQFYNTDIKPAWLSADCFHPNTTGQTELANRLWAAQPWFN